jgi:hypothetical protein
MKARRPNLFLVGHPRSGTGSLDSYLQAHPKIFMGQKELHYFNKELGFNKDDRTLENYLSHFKGATEPIVGESSTWYLSTQSAAQKLHRFSEDAKIIIILRYPVDWLHSLHSHMVYAAYEDIRDFQEALSAEPSRLEGKRLPKLLFPKNGVLYRQLARYTEQVERFIDTFGPDKVKILLLDDMKRSPDAMLDEVFDFLGIERDFEGREKVLEGTKKSRNANHRHRSRRLHQWLKSPPRRSIYQGVIEGPVPWGRYIIGALQRLNTSTGPRQNMPDALREELHIEFYPEFERLEKLLQRDLTIWKSRGVGQRI